MLTPTQTHSLLFACTALLPVGAASAQDAQELETVQVFGTRERAYRATVAPTANKSDATVKETPFSIQTVTRELIEDRGVITFGEAVRTVPGLTPQVGWGGSNDRFRLRGFPTSSNLKNGFRRSVFAPIDELANIEQIEVLKGPASALYGRFEPGGVVNLVTKKPLWVQETKVDVTAGSHDLFRSTLDTTGPLSETLAYRLNASWQDGGGFRDFARSETQFISPVLQWKPSARTTVTAEFEYARKRAAFDRGFGSDPIFLTVPIRNNYGERDARIATTSKTASLTVDHALNDRWAIKAGAQISDSHSDAVWYPYNFMTPVSGKDTDQPIVNRSRQRNVDDQQDIGGMIELSGKLATGSVKHRVLFGLDADREHWDFSAYNNPNAFGFSTNLPIDLYRPIHGQVPPASFVRYDAATYKNENVGAYFQDEMQLTSHWKFLAGARYDHSRTSSQADFFSRPGEVKSTANAFSPRLGLTWTPVEQASFYGSWSRSFLTEISSGLLQDGNIPDPSRGKQIEFGTKLSLLDGRLEPTFAVFDIRRTNGVVTDPADFNSVIQVGEKRSRGWEIDVPFTISEHWRVLASYTHLNAKISDDSDPEMVGKRLENAPQKSASLWTTYDFREAAPGLSTGFGIIYVGERQANSSNTFTLPAYTRFDANVAYRFGPKDRYRVQLNIQNLTNKRYYDSGGSFVPTYPGAPRTVLATVGVSF